MKLRLAPGLFTVLLAALPAGARETSPPLSAFATGGHTVYHLQPVALDRAGARGVVSAAFDGTVLCHSRDGRLQWQTRAGDRFPFDLAVADTDGDGLEEVYVATAAGTIDAFDHDGRRRWTFAREAPFHQVCPLRTASGQWVILAGGIEETLFALSPAGELRGSRKTGDVVRHIRGGNIKGDGQPYAAVATASNGRNGRLSLLLIDPETLDVVWHRTDLEKGLYRNRQRFFSMIVCDLDADGREEIVLSSSWEYHGLIVAYDHRGERVLTSSDPRIPNADYRMPLLTHVKPARGGEERILSLYANYLIVYDRRGRFQSLLTSRYDFANAAFDPQTGTYYLGSSTAGGDGIYALDLTHPGWPRAFEGIRPVGRLAEIERNVEVLQTQLASFRRPAYQPAPGSFTVQGSPPAGAEYRHVRFVARPQLLQKVTDRTQLWCRDIDRRFEYRLTQAEILASVRAREARGGDFYVVAGHGTAVYMAPDTLEKIIAAAPRHFQGFVFAELQDVDAKMQEIVERILLPLARHCQRAGRKIVLENKNIFWAGTCYLGFWNRILLNPDFKDVFVPALEESNSRTQELSLAGRVGLWATGSFDRWLSRSIMDNACFNRWWEWSSPQVLSHYLRHLALTVTLGSDQLAVGILQGPLSKPLGRQLRPFYEMLEKGVLVAPRPDDLLSLSDLCLGMRSPPAKRYLAHGINSHRCDFDEVARAPMVFDRLDNYWGGAPVADHDFSGYGYGCARRMLNFLPTTPFGLVPIVPDHLDLARFPRFREKLSTDGEFFYDESGRAYGAAEYKPIVLEKLAQAAARLPVRVRGDAAWSVVRIDPSHLRVTLVDPGYLDPAPRNVAIVLQGVTARAGVDLLSGERLTLRDGAIHLTVPAGLFRVVDLELAPKRP